MNRICNDVVASNAADSMALDRLIAAGVAGSNATYSNCSATRIDDKTSLLHVKNGGGYIHLPQSYNYGSSQCEWEIIYIS